MIFPHRWIQTTMGPPYKEKGSNKGEDKNKGHLMALEKEKEQIDANSLAMFNACIAASNQWQWYYTMLLTQHQLELMQWNFKKTGNLSSGRYPGHSLNQGFPNDTLSSVSDSSSFSDDNSEHGGWGFWDAVNEDVNSKCVSVKGLEDINEGTSTSGASSSPLTSTVVFGGWDDPLLCQLDGEDQEELLQNPLSPENILPPVIVYPTTPPQSNPPSIPPVLPQSDVLVPPSLGDNRRSLINRDRGRRWRNNDQGGYENERRISDNPLDRFPIGLYVKVLFVLIFVEAPFALHGLFLGVLFLHLTGALDPLINWLAYGRGEGGAVRAGEDVEERTLNEVLNDLRRRRDIRVQTETAVLEANRVLKRFHDVLEQRKQLVAANVLSGEQTNAIPESQSLKQPDGASQAEESSLTTNHVVSNVAPITTSSVPLDLDLLNAANNNLSDSSAAILATSSSSSSSSSSPSYIFSRPAGRSSLIIESSRGFTAVTLSNGATSNFHVLLPSAGSSSTTRRLLGLLEPETWRRLVTFIRNFLYQLVVVFLLSLNPQWRPNLTYILDNRPAVTATITVTMTNEQPTNEATNRSPEESTATGRNVVSVEQISNESTSVVEDVQMIEDVGKVQTNGLLDQNKDLLEGANDTGLDSQTKRGSDEDSGKLKERLGKDSFRKFEDCWLCLKPAVNPVCTPTGYVYCRECVILNLGKQKEDIERDKRLWEINQAKRKEEDLEKISEEKEEEIRRFIDVNNKVITQQTPKPADHKTVFVELNKAESRSNNFWIAENTPTGTSVNTHQASKCPSRNLVCPVSKTPLRLKDLITIKPDISIDETTDTVKWVCSISNKEVGHQKSAVVKATGQIVLMSCVDAGLLKGFVPSLKNMKPSKDLVTLIPGGTGFSSHNKVEAEVSRPVME